jgi:hypothetical protein
MPKVFIINGQKYYYLFNGNGRWSLVAGGWSLVVGR